ncbi:MAG: GTPase ObgE [Endomicrobia bacterium]|nr:GTPase ObgE [Endomicrobiia bacterium]
MFVDVVKIYVESGKGGNGCVSFRREKFVPYGGPDGGRGGKGGDVYLRANPNITTLYDFTLRPHFKAEDGEHGKGKNMYGKDGRDLYIDVPCGTVVYKLDENKNKIFLADLTKPYEVVLVAKGGRGGRGNADFKSSTNRAPRIAELGQPSEKVTLILELKLIADVGIIGLPNAGKSTLLSVITAAKPKIADYPFTTLSPNLGTLVYHDKKLVVADIPGLIEDAHKGKGLGTDFLRHIERTRMLVHLIDISCGDFEKIYKNYQIVINELKSYSEKLIKKPMIVVLNKIDTISLETKNTLIKKFKLKLKKYPVLAISAFKKEGITELVKKIVQIIEDIKDVEPILEKKQEIIEYKEDFKIEKIDNKFIIKGKKIEDLVKMTDFSSKESIERFHSILKKLKIEKKLKEKGIKVGDKVLISDVEFEFIE